MCDLSVKNLACASREEQQMFLSSIDHILSDIDGVIWIGYTPLSGASECIENLKKLKKKINFITNNTTFSTVTIHKLLLKNKISVNLEDIVNPALAYIDYLGKQNFSKQLYVCGGQGLKDDLTNAGLKLAPISAVPIKENIPDVIEAIADNEEIGGVIFDFDINLTLLKLQKCVTLLNRKDCLFLVGATDKTIPFPSNGPIIGNYYFCQFLKEFTGRTPYHLAKPSSDYNQFIVERFGIKEPKKVLIIGDSINEDMKFAAIGGYQKLLVLTGNATQEDVIQWKHGVDSKPAYYVDSLAQLNLILGMLQVK